MIIQKPVTDYGSYVWKQGGKARLQKDKLLSGASRRQQRFAELFAKIKGHLSRGKPVLCLGARTGCEVVGAESAGFIGSIGIDLFPLAGNVVEADWHNMPFADNSFENVFCNCLDHCADIKKLVTEIKRVLKPSGVFVMAASHGPKIGGDIKIRVARASKEFLFWEHPVEIAQVFIASGFSLNHETDFGTDKIYVLRAK